MLSMFLREDGENIIFTGHKLELYIPELYTESGIANIEGHVFKTFGIIPCRVFNKDDKVIGNYMLNLPTTISLNFSEYTVQSLEFHGEEPANYAVIHYYNQEPIMPVVIEKNSGAAERFLNLITSGKITGISYNEIIISWLKNLDLSGAKLGITMLVLEIIISEVYRNKNNPDEKFSHYLGRVPNASTYDYRPANMREICSRNSTFAALTFEDIDMMITTSLNMTQYNKKQVESPIEKIIKM